VFGFLSSRRNRAAPETALEALDRGDYAAAEPLLTRAIEGAEHPREQAFYFNKRGVARIELNRRDEARTDFVSALQCVQRYAPALTNVGNLLLEEDRVDDAVAYYCRAIEADGEYAAAYVNLATAYKRAGRFDEAVRALRTGLRLAGRARGRKRVRPREDR